MAYTKDTADRLKDIKQKVGMRDRLEQLAEEASELSQAALKYIRATKKTDNPTPVSPQDAYKSLLEEAADVTVSLRSIDVHTFTTEDIEEKKIKRWHDRLKEANNVNKTVEASDNALFKVGDRVRYIKTKPNHGKHYYPPIGTVGTVVEVFKLASIEESLMVQWPDGTMQGDGKWPIGEGCVVKVEPIYVEVGDCVRLVDESLIDKRYMTFPNIGSIGIVKMKEPEILPIGSRRSRHVFIEWIADENGDAFCHKVNMFVVEEDILDQFFVKTDMKE